MIHVAVVRLVSPDDKKHVTNSGIFRELPVVLCHLRSRHGLPVLHGAVVNVVDELGVSGHCFLLNVADESVAELGRAEVCEEKEVVEDALADHDAEAEERPGLLHGKERQQVHSLVLCLFQQCVNPPVVALQPSEGAEVAESGCNAARNAGNGLEENDSGEPLVLVQLPELEARDSVEVESDHLDGVMCELVQSSLGLPMLELHTVDVVVLPQGMSERVVLHWAHVAFRSSGGSRRSRGGLALRLLCSPLLLLLLHELLDLRGSVGTLSHSHPRSVIGEQRDTGRPSPSLLLHGTASPQPKAGLAVAPCSIASTLSARPRQHPGRHASRAWRGSNSSLHHHCNFSSVTSLRF
mmetsp:Transcript_16126/g.62892  ORF Transcript_16126/g.62892 Transcript_16126/m.62892 type:complete len:352 (+) Transcript_16126:85-1140(+)